MKSQTELCGHLWEAVGKTHRCSRDKGHPGPHSTVPDVGAKSHYVVQSTTHSICPKCSKYLDLLCHEWAGPRRDRSFYICWNCRKVYEVGKGEVRRDG